MYPSMYRFIGAGRLMFLVMPIEIIIHHVMYRFGECKLWHLGDFKTLVETFHNHWS